MTWLGNHPAVLSALRWESAQGVRDFYGWSASQRQDLYDTYWRLDGSGALNLPDPAPNALNLEDDQWAATALTIENAWPLYIAFVANSLHVEIRHRVPWRIAEATPEALDELFDSRALFRRDTNGLYNVALEYIGHGSGGDVLPSPPDVVWRFFESNGFVGADRIDTIGRLLEWCRQNLKHYIGRMGAANAEQHWQYRGVPPVSRIINGTVFTGLDGMFPNPEHWTAGCHGTNGFLAATLRALNIPVDCIRKAGHATPKFVWDSRYLSHGDDPYDRYVRTASYPGTELLIDEGQYLQWFDPQSPETHANNIGRRARELALIYLPTYLLRQHCGDLAAGRSHANSTVAAVFSRWYTVAELEALQLWQRLDARVAVLGGCANVPYVP